MPVVYLIYSFCIIILFINIWYYKSTKHPWRNGIIGSAAGIAVMIPTQMVLEYFSFPFILNYFTIAISLLLGIPGVILSVIYTIFI